MVEDFETAVRMECQVSQWPYLINIDVVSKVEMSSLCLKRIENDVRHEHREAFSRITRGKENGKSISE